MARDAAEAAGAAAIEIAGRDVDVPLSSLGERQALALGAWFARQPVEQRPTVVLCSPYLRAQRTAQLVAAEVRAPWSTDERLREKEFGALNRLTGAGILAQYPQEARRRAEIGKFYYRPPGGESWCDVLLRLRSLLDQLQLRSQGQRVLIVAHQVVVLCFRYLLEGLDEQRLLAIDSAGDVANCALTTYERAIGEGGQDALLLRAYNLSAPLEQGGALVTAAPDVAVKK